MLVTKLAAVLKARSQLKPSNPSGLKGKKPCSMRIAMRTTKEIRGEDERA